jgi:Rrf2 family protein
MAATSRFAIATHLLTAIALLTREDEWVTSTVLAGSVNTNPVVVRRLLAQLGKAGLVRARTGKTGGVALARPAAKITLLDVYRAAGEEPVFGLNPNDPNPLCPISRCMGRLLDPVQRETSTAVHETLSRHRLSELVARVRM